MFRHLKTAKPLSERAEDDARMRASVEAVLADISARGDAAVRKLSARFDNFVLQNFGLPEREIEFPVGRCSEVEDVLGAVRFRAGDASVVISGTDLLTDGYWTAR